MSATAFPVPAEIVVKFAPIVCLLAGEEYYPDNPMAFLKSSRLHQYKVIKIRLGRNGPIEFAHKYHASWNKVLKRFVGEGHNTHIDCFDIPVAKINSFKKDGNKNVRPFDDNRRTNGKELYAVESFGDRKGNFEPNGKVPAFFHVKQLAVDPQLKAGVVSITYWVFFGYSRGVNAGPFHFNHQGDWERVVVELSCRSVGGKVIFSPAKVRYNAHGDYRDVAWKDVPKSKGRILAYCERGGHAMSPDSDERVPGGGGRFGDDTQQREDKPVKYRWNTALLLKDLEKQPWKDFAGAWGHVGSWGSDTTGPLGPYLKD